jgi:hypothetical protein
MNRWPVHIKDDDVGYFWFAEPNFIVNQPHVDSATEELAGRFNDHIDELLLTNAAALAAAGGAIVIGDWRLVKNYSPAARRAFVERVRKRPPSLMQASIVILEKVAPLLRMAVQTTDLLSTVTGRSRVRVSDDIESIFAELGVRTPAPMRKRATRPSIPPRS